MIGFISLILLIINFCEFYVLHSQMPGVVLNEKEIRENFKEERTLELVSFEIRKKRGKNKTVFQLHWKEHWSYLDQLIFIKLSSSHLTQIEETHP